MILNCNIYVYILNDIVYACCSRFFFSGKSVYTRLGTYNFQIILIPKANKYDLKFVLNIYEKKNIRIHLSK